MSLNCARCGKLLYEINYAGGAYLCKECFADNSSQLSGPWNTAVQTPGTGNYSTAKWCTAGPVPAQLEEGGGTKYDSGKPPLSIIPQVYLVETAKVFDFGAKKYNRFNFRSGFKQSRLLDAALRHITAYAWGEDLDPESNLGHLAHASCCLAILMQNVADGKDTDDRPTPFPAKTEEDK